MSDFDDLFNDFLNPEEPNNNDNEPLNDEAQKIIDMINSFKNNPESMDLDKIDEELEDTLGEPDSIQYEQTDDFYIERRIWYKETGVIIKTLMSETPFDEPIIEEELSLSEQLDKAVASEDYELAASIRDKIKKDIAKQKRLAKKMLSQNSDFQDITKNIEKK